MGRYRKPSKLMMVNYNNKMTNNENLADLNKFQEDSGLKDLENLLKKFNVFDVLNITHAEIRHSSVLAWLLDPNENHNISDKALRLFLESIASGVELGSLLEDDLKLEDVEVRKEWEHIDISLLIKTKNEKTLIIIENKIKAKDSNKQLERYRNIVENKFKQDYKKIFIYLTPDGDEPNDKNELQYWNIFSYRQIVKEVLDKVVPVVSNDEIKKFIEQYIGILRRVVLEDTEVNSLCSKIYKDHKKAIDLIFEARDDTQLEIKSFLEDKVEKEGFIIDDVSKTHIRFTTSILSKNIKIKGEGWTSTKRILLFEFKNKRNGLGLKLIIGPGEESQRNNLFCFMKKHEKVFTKTTSVEKISGKWKTVFSKTILNKNDYSRKDTIGLKKKIEDSWPKIVKQIQEIDDIFNNNWSG